MTSVTGTRFYTIKEIGGYTYNEPALNIGIAAARRAGVKVSQVGTVIDCPTLTDLTNLYQLFFTGANDANHQIWNTTSTRFKDLGKRAYFKVNGQIVQVWALVTLVNGKLTEGAGNPSVWLPVYCSFDSLTDPVFDDPRVASLTF